MIKDDIKNPKRLGNYPDAIVEGLFGEAAIGLTAAGDGDVGVIISKNASDNFYNSTVRVAIIAAEKAHALGKALIELSGIEEVMLEEEEDKPLHISLEEYGELREGDKVILRKDTNSREVFEFGYVSRFHEDIQNGTPAVVQKIDTDDDSVRLINSNGMYGWFSYKSVKEVIKAPRHISKEEFDSIEVGDKLIIRKDLIVDASYGGVYVNAEMKLWADNEVPLKVIGQSLSIAKVARNEHSGGQFNYSKEMIQEVIKAPKEHFRVRLSTKIWYAGKGGQITLDKDLAAIMNKPHAENVVKKYGGQLVKVDYSELEDK